MTGLSFEWKCYQNKVFGYFIDDTSNYNNEFLRIRIRNLLNNLKHEGFNKEKFEICIFPSNQYLV